MMMLVDPITMIMMTMIMMTMIMMVSEAIKKMMMVIMMIAHLDVDLSMSLPPTSPSPFVVIKALVQEYDY